MGDTILAGIETACTPQDNVQFIERLDPEAVRLADAAKSAAKLLSRKITQRDRLNQEIAILSEALAGRGRAFSKAGKARAPRSSVKDAVLSLLEERGAYGLNAQIACDLSAQRGERIHRGTVSSLLSRLKNDNVLTYDGRVYRLKGQDPASSTSRVGEG